ncbi:MAG: glutathione S-transferase family protein [Hyphomicrobiaceae bacterium]
MHLYIGNKLYSSWSLRPWIAMTALGIPFEETVIPLFKADFADRISEISAAGLVPVLVDGDIKVWETLAILEYLAEKYPDKNVWPADRQGRAHARAVSAEMHAGFSALRSACPMNLGKRFAGKDRGADVAANVSRLCAIVGEARERFGASADGPFLYGAFTAADAMYAPLLTRIDTYGIKVDDVTQAYIDAVLSSDTFGAWKTAALKEDWIVAEDEVDEPAIENLRPHLAQG